jgi:hypothetical protein
MQERIRAENDKYDSDKNAGDNSGDFHATMLTGPNWNSNPEVSQSWTWVCRDPSWEKRGRDRRS